MEYLSIFYYETYSIGLKEEHACLKILILQRRKTLKVLMEQKLDKLDHVFKNQLEFYNFKIKELILKIWPSQNHDEATQKLIQITDAIRTEWLPHYVLSVCILCIISSGK